MDDIQRRADHEAWDKKADRRISNINQAIEQGVTGEALAALHGLHFPPANEPPYDVDDRSNVDDKETLSGKIVSRLIQIENTISLNRDLPDDVKQKWIAILQECYPREADSVNLLRDLKHDIKVYTRAASIACLKSSGNGASKLFHSQVRG